MKNFWNLFLLILLLSIIFTIVDWSVDGFNFLQFQEQHFYFHSWISIAGILFSSTMAITSYFIYKSSKILSLRYVSISFLLTALAYAIIGYHASYCQVCSDLGYCAASHSYSIYLMIIVFVIFVLTIIMFNKKIDIVKKAQLLQKFSYGLIVATILLGIALFISLEYLEIHDTISYLGTVNLQAFVFLLPVVIIVIASIYFRRHYETSNLYVLMAVIASLSFLPQFLHIFSCKDCHMMECSEFYILSGLIMLIVTGLLIYSIGIQLQEKRK